MSAPEQVDLGSIHKQQYAHLGRLNESLYKMPSIFASITGGLWFFAAGYIEKDRVIACAVFLFAAAVSMACLAAIQSFRLAFNAYLDSLNRLDREWAVTIKGKPAVSTVAAMAALMRLAAGLSFAAAIYAGWPMLARF